jgi:hypothetical protein
MKSSIVKTRIQNLISKSKFSLLLSSKILKIHIRFFSSKKFESFLKKTFYSIINFPEKTIQKFT